jgi:membrane associated rhomboid family serine protease
VNRISRTATVAIAVVTALAWLIAEVLGLSGQAAQSLGFIPARLSGAAVPWAAVPAALTPLTATLVHGNFAHVAFNMIFFLWCGTHAERMLGKTGLIILYLIGGYAAAGAQWVVDPMSTQPMIGASGAVSAVVGGYALSFGRPRMVTRSARLNRWINAIWLMAAWVVIQAMMSWLAGTEGFMLATPAHIGGFAAGLLLQRPLLLWRYRSA